MYKILIILCASYINYRPLCRTVIRVPFYEWNSKEDDQQKEDYLLNLMTENGWKGPTANLLSSGTPSGRSASEERTMQVEHQVRETLQQGSGQIAASQPSKDLSDAMAQELEPNEELETLGFRCSGSVASNDIPVPIQDSEESRYKDNVSIQSSDTLGQLHESVQGRRNPSTSFSKGEEMTVEIEQQLVESPLSLAEVAAEREKLKARMKLLAKRYASPSRRPGLGRRT